MAAFWVKLGTNDLNCVDVPLNSTHSLCGYVGLKQLSHWQRVVQ